MATRTLAAATPEAGVREINPEDAVDRFPALASPLRALWVPRAARVDGRQMSAALLASARAAGLNVVTGMVGDIEIDGAHHPRRFRAVDVDGRRLQADALVVAGGAWTPALSARLGVSLPVSPLRGQIVHLVLEGTETAHWPIAHQVLGHYLVAWPGGRIAVGATVEEAGFEARPTAGGLHEVLREALRVAPGLAGATFSEVRVGLRPFSHDGLPIVGPIPGVAGAWVATGHGTDGLLLGPVSGRVVAEMVLGGAVTSDVDLSAFVADRFTSM
jgi:D-amino-acid dehydrogenase